MLRRLQSWALSALFLALVAWSVSSSTKFQSCIEKEKHETAAQHFQNGAAQFIAIYRPCIGDFVHDNGEAIIAVFTIVLALSTIFLWGATRDLVSGADDTARRQLRAYLSINPTVVENYGTQKRATINWVVKNHGQTPASEIRYKFSIEVMPDPLPSGFDFSKPQLEVTSDSSLFPSGGDPTNVLKAWFNNDRPFTDDEYDSIEAGTHRIHVWGIMTYRDVFKRARTTIFNASIGGPDFKETMRQTRSGKTNPGPGYLWVHAGNHNQST